MDTTGGLFATETRARTSDGKSSDYLDKRILRGYLIVWNVRDYFGTKFLKGCCARSIRERGPQSNAAYKITCLWQHDQTDPLGLFDILEEDDFGLYFETKPLDAVENAERAITQIRSKTINQFSAGFDYIWDQMEYDPIDDSVVCKEIELMEGSVVTIGGIKETFAVRSINTLVDLADDTSFFIRSLPRKFQTEARELFTRHKSMIDTTDALEQGNKGTGEDIKAEELIVKQKRSHINNFIIKNLNKENETGKA